MTSTLISVILPVYFEELAVKECYRRVKAVFATLQGYQYELIFVDDGSADNTLTLVKEIAAVDRAVKVISFSRNFGHQAALTAGLEKARGAAVFILDADLQDPPELLPEMIARWEEGYEVVYGIRKRRQDRWLKKALAYLYYRMLRRLSDVPLILDSGDFCLLSRRVVDKMNLLPERNRYIRGLRSWVGFKQTGVEYQRDKRKSGEPKYTFYKSLKLGLDGIASFSHKPLRLAVTFGFLFTLVAVAMIVYGLVVYFVFPERVVPGWASTFIAVVFFAGLQLLTLGILGEYIGRIFDEVKNRPMYIIREEINFDREENGQRRKN